jgi:CspA family cold shock protein
MAVSLSGAAPGDRVPDMATVTATVREWYDEEGWGVLDSPETPEGCWAHFSNIETDGFRSLPPPPPVSPAAR